MLDFSSPAASFSLPVVSGRPRTPAHRLAEDNAALVWHVLHKKLPFLATDPNRREDAWSAGYVGLVEAAERFDPRRGHSFSTYATRYIEGRILHSLRPDKRAARIPCVSLETPIGDGENDLAEVVANTQAEVPGAGLLFRDEAARLLSLLPEREQAVLWARYGEEMPCSEIGAALGVSAGRVYQIEQAALKRVRKKGRTLLAGGVSP